MRIHYAAILLAAPLWAQQPATKLTLAEAERLAVQNNPQLSAAKFNAAAAYQIPLEYRAGLMPTVAGALTGVGADSGSRLPAGALNNPVVYNRVASGLLVNQLVTDFGRTGNLIASSRLRAQAQDQFTETARADILVTTARAYFAVLRTQAVLMSRSKRSPHASWFRTR